MIGSWLAKRLPARVNLPPDSFQFARDHFLETKPRGKVTVDPFKGTGIGEGKVFSTEIE